MLGRSREPLARTQVQNHKAALGELNSFFIDCAGLKTLLMPGDALKSGERSGALFVSPLL